MYLPRLLEETDLPTLHGLLRAHPLGMWVTQAGSELVGNHIPFLLDADRGPFGTLVGHVARANPVWESFSTAGNWKANQTTTPADKVGVIEGLLERGDAQSQEMAALVPRRATPPEGK